MTAWIDVGPLPTDQQLETHMRPQGDPLDTFSPADLPPYPDDADFDAPPAGTSVGVWGMLVAYDHEIRALKRRVKTLEQRFLDAVPPCELEV